MPGDEFLRRCFDTSPQVAIEELVVRTRALLGLDGMRERVRHEPLALTDGDLLGRQRRAIRLAQEGFTTEALADFADLAAAAEVSGNGLAHRRIRLNHGQVLVMLSRLDESVAEFAAVRQAAGLASDADGWTWSTVLLAEALYELGRYPESLAAIADAEAALNKMLPASAVGHDGPLRQAIVSLVPHDTRVDAAMLWWRLQHLRMKVLIERWRVNGVRDGIGYLQARAAAEASRQTSDRLELPAVGHDLLWMVRLCGWANSPDAWRESGGYLAQARPLLARGVGPAYYHRAAATRRASGDALDSERRAISSLLLSADLFCAYGDARGLGPALSEVALSLAGAVGLSAGGRTERRDQAVAFGLAAAALHPHGLVRHNVSELLGATGAGADTRGTVRHLMDDLLSFRGEPFSHLRRLARQLWTDTEKTMLSNVKMSAFAPLLAGWK